MIIDEFVEITLNSKNLKKFIELGYNGKIREKIKISIAHLSKGSKCKVNIKCDNCNEIKKVYYNNYNKNKDNCYYCSACKEIRRKKTCLIKYGVESPNSSDIVKEKLKNNNIKKYGVGNPFELSEIKDKIKKTKLEKYDDSFYNNREKSKQTCLEKYGVENTLQNENIKQKSKQTCLEKYGVDSYMKTEKFRKKSIKFFNENENEIAEKRKNTNLLKYGVENVFADYNTQQKIKQTLLEKYGVEYPIQNEDIFLKTQKSRFKIEKYKNTDIYSQGSYEKDFLENFYDKIEIERAKSFLYPTKDSKHY